MPQLNWPKEQLHSHSAYPWSQSASNICLDLHGNPLDAELVVFSDGNHHMALRETLQAFTKEFHCHEIFYVTTPPRILLHTLQVGAMQLGNLVIPMRPHLLISPKAILQNVIADGHMLDCQPFMLSHGASLLVANRFADKLECALDFFTDNLRLFLSNPTTESASHSFYNSSLQSLIEKCDITEQALNLIYGETIHHREAPEAIVNHKADGALLYSHLAQYYANQFPEHFRVFEIEETNHLSSETYFGLIDDGGQWGNNISSFLQSKKVTKIYQDFGLDRVRQKETADAVNSS